VKSRQHQQPHGHRHHFLMLQIISQTQIIFILCSLTLNNHKMQFKPNNKNVFQKILLHKPISQMCTSIQHQHDKISTSSTKSCHNSNSLHEELVSFSHSVHVNFSWPWRFWWSSITRNLNSHSSSYEKCSNNRGWNTYNISTQHNTCCVSLYAAKQGQNSQTLS